MAHAWCCYKSVQRPGFLRKFDVVEVDVGGRVFTTQGLFDGQHLKLLICSLLTVGSLCCSLVQANLGAFFASRFLQAHLGHDQGHVDIAFWRYR